MIRLADVTFEVDTSNGPRRLLQPLNLELAEHRISLIGANGSGKSTLLRLLNGLVLPTTGTVQVGELDTRRDGPAVRRRVGLLFTEPLNQLVLPTPLDDVALSLRERVPNRKARRRAAADWLERFGLGALADQSSYQLSGGERQLAALVSVLAVEPDVLLCDEPTTLLDLPNRNLFERTLADLPQQVIVATHDLDLAATADRALLLDRGRLVADGPAAEVVARYRALVS